MKSLRKLKAFTIVEMSIVIAVIAILSAVMIPTIGGIIKKAKISADENTAVNLTTQLALWTVNNGEIKNESDLRAAIGNDVYDSLEPKSAKYGYHYWYDVDAGRIVLKSYAELAEINTAMVDGIEEEVVFGLAADDDTDNFAAANPRSIEINNKNYFLLDKGGSDFISFVNNLGNVADIDAYEEAIKGIKNHANDSDSLYKEVAKKILDKINITTIITSSGAYRCNKASEIEHVWISSTAGNLEHTEVNVVDGVDEPAADQVKIAGDKVTSLELPADTTVGISGLPALKVEYVDNATSRDYTGTTKLYVSTNNVDDLKNIFTDCVIVTPNGSEYVYIDNKFYSLPIRLDGGAITNNPAGSVDPSVLTFEGNLYIDCIDKSPNPNQGPIYFSSSDKILYVAYSTSEIALSLVDDDGNNLATSMVDWTCSNNDLLNFNNGKFTINNLFGANSEASIKATYKYDDTKTDTITVCVVRPASVDFKIDTNTINLDNDADYGLINITYTGENSVQDISKITNVELSQTGMVVTEVVADTGTLSFQKWNRNTESASDFTDADLFKIVDSKLTINTNVINGENSQDIVITYTGESGIKYFERIYTVKIKDESASTIETKYNTDYLFRVGNGNAVKLSYLFEAADPNKTVNFTGVTIYDAFQTYAGTDSQPVRVEINNKNNFNCTYTPATDWQNATLEFTGTGCAIIVVSTKEGDREFVVEVVNATNVTEYKTNLPTGSWVLLNDIEITTGAVHSFSNATLYGNGFTFDIKNGANAHSQFAVLRATNTTFDNVKIVGDTYTTFTTSTGADTPWSSAAIYFGGTSKIVNSYVYGCRAPIRAQGDQLTIENTVVAGGRYANVDLRKGALILKGAITVNSSGLGIVFNDTGNDSRSVMGTVKQYNWVCADDKEKFPSDYQSLTGEMFKNSAYQCSYNEVTYVNTGIVSLNTAANVVSVSGYTQYNVSYSGITRKLWTIPSSYTLAADDIKYRTEEHPFTPEQGITKPEITWTRPSEYDATSGKILLEIKEGVNTSVSLNLNMLTATKYGTGLPVSVKVNGVSQTGNSYTFTEGGSYVVEYEITDDIIFRPDGTKVDGGSNATYTESVTVYVNYTKKTTAAPTFTFFYGRNGTSAPYLKQPTSSMTASFVEIGGVYYVTGQSGSNFGSKTIEGQTIYYPIVDGINVSSGTGDLDWQRYYPIFKAVTIVDNDDTYDYDTKEMPNALTWVSAEGTGGNGQGLANTYGVYEGHYCRNSAGAGNNEDGSNAVVKFQYLAADGKTYVYYIGYTFYNESEVGISGGGCVTGDTLVTLADGTQKRVDALTFDDVLLVWDFYVGDYTAMPASLLFDHGYANNTIIKLTFEDGTVVKVVNSHQFFDTELNRFISIVPDTADNYIGHSFVKEDRSIVKLVDVEVYEEYCVAYGALSAYHYNIFVNGMLSADFAPESFDLFTYFEVGDDMKYDEEQLLSDIETYGLYTYEEFKDCLTYEQFDAFNIKYMKISVGKGYSTLDKIMQIIENYVNN